jgi:hypothetical protein
MQRSEPGSVCEGCKFSTMSSKSKEEDKLHFGIKPIPYNLGYQDNNCLDFMLNIFSIEKMYAKSKELFF